jgi:hypothetical protein
MRGERRDQNGPKPPRDVGARRAGVRRPADRHYLAVVAAEARRLAHQLRPPLPPTSIRPEGSH